MRTIYGCNFCGFISDEAGKVAQHEKKHDRANQITVAAGAEFLAESVVPRLLLVQSSNGKFHEYTLVGTPMTEQEAIADSNAWVWRRGMGSNK